jgi:DNA-binding winged helix-turn-helix (wHTH) protein
VQARFATFTLDRAARELRRGGQPIHISPKAFELLSLLVQRCPCAVSKQELHRALWPATFVSDGSLAVLVNELRRTLGDSARHPRFVRTVARFGYAFVGDLAGSTHADTPRAPCTLAWAGQHARLEPGENVLGRDPSADIHVDAVGVSRRHAVIVVEPEQVTLADLTSKNGTFVDGRRVGAPVCLADEAEIRLGAVPLRFRRKRFAQPTDTVTVAQ